MTRYLLLRQLRRPLVLACLVVPPALACTDTLLNVTDPDIILGANSASSAIGLSNGAVLRLAQAVSGTQGPDALFLFGGLLTDEWRSGDTIINDSLFTLGIANADSALAIAGSDTASPRVKAARFAMVIKGRALVDRADFTAAAAAVATVPDTFRYDVTHSLNVNDNQMWALNASARRYTMGDVEGKNGLPYVTANDPRIPRRIGTSLKDDGIFDSAFPILVIREGIWGRTSAVTIASGIEARLIAAEERLRAGDYATWISIINTLRTTTTLYPPIQSGFTRGPALTALTDPGATLDTAARTNLMFYERAFWLFSTGHRLGDMRRLLRQYEHPDSIVYPTGAWFKGGPYGDAIQMVLPVEELNNTNFHGCADRKP